LLSKATCHRGPATHRTHPTAPEVPKGPPDTARHPPYGEHPGEPLSGGSTISYDRSLARRGACEPVQKATITKSLQDMVQFDQSGSSPDVTLSGSFLCFPFPLVGPAAKWKGSAARIGLVAAFRFSAKFICMGNRPNRLTAIQKKNRPSRFFGTWPFFGCPALHGTEEATLQLSYPAAVALHNEEGRHPPRCRANWLPYAILTYRPSQVALTLLTVCY